MSAQTVNARKYNASLTTLVQDLFHPQTGARLFNMAGGAVEGERIAKTLDEAKALHPRSKVWKSALTIWASLIRETMETNPENLDWAVLQGSLFAGWELPNEPLDKDEDVNLDTLADEDL